jgi:aspartate carbamoyltransferase regulatory subunit
MKYNYTKENRIEFKEVHSEDSFTQGLIKIKDEQALINSGVDIAEYIKPVKTINQIQDEAISAMESIVIAECRSGTGKLYFKDLNSAARHSSEIQTDSEIRDRAVSLLKWDIAIDAYALSVVFDIENGGDIPTIESFIAGLPKI